MHPNDNLYLLALLFALPLSSAVPIFSGSKDIDENGNFLPKGGNAVRLPARTAEALDRRDIFGDLIGTVENTVGDLAEGILGPAMGKRDQQSYGLLTRRDVVGELNGVVDAANQAFGTIAGDVSQGLNPPDIPHIPSKRSFGDLGPNDVSCMAIGGICDPQPVCAGAPGFCPGHDNLDRDPGPIFERNERRGLIGALPPAKRSSEGYGVTCAGKDCFGDVHGITDYSGTPYTDLSGDGSSDSSTSTAKRGTQKLDLSGALPPSKRSIPQGAWRLSPICAGINCPGSTLFPNDSLNENSDNVPQDVPSDSSTANAKRATWNSGLLNPSRPPGAYGGPIFWPNMQTQDGPNPDVTQDVSSDSSTTKAKRGTQKRSLVGALPPAKRSLPEGTFDLPFVCGGINCYQDPDSNPFPILTDLPLPDRPVDDGTMQDVTSDSSTSDSAKAKRGTLLPPRQLPSGSIMRKRDVVGELNGLIGEANQAFDHIAGDIAPNLNPPDIPNIPTP